MEIRKEEKVMMVKPIEVTEHVAHVVSATHDEMVRMFALGYKIVKHYTDGHVICTVRKVA